jgi:hypothetical protein
MRPWLPPQNIRVKHLFIRPTEMIGAVAVAQDDQDSVHSCTIKLLIG